MGSSEVALTETSVHTGGPLPVPSTRLVPQMVDVDTAPVVAKVADFVTANVAEHEMHRTTVITHDVIYWAVRVNETATPKGKRL